MANRSVTIPSSSINPVSHLSYLIKAALHESCNQPPDFHENYRRQFATLIGLGSSVILASGNGTQPSLWHLLTFWSYGDNFTQSEDKFERLSVIVAETICNAIISFKHLGMPRYFDDFMLAMTDVIYPVSTEVVEKKRNIRELLQALFEKCD